MGRFKLNSQQTDKYSNSNSTIEIVEKGDKYVENNNNKIVFPYSRWVNGLVIPEICPRARSENNTYSMHSGKDICVPWHDFFLIIRRLLHLDFA